MLYSTYSFVVEYGFYFFTYIQTVFRGFDVGTTGF